MNHIVWIARTAARFSLAVFLLAGLVLFFPTHNAQAAALVVSNFNDDGPGSLRAMILQANGSPGTDTITFAASGTVTLESDLPVITDDLIIDGSGQAITISGDGANAIFYAYKRDQVLNLTIQYLTIADGRAAGGAGLYSHHAQITLSHVTFQNNQAMAGGAIVFNDGTLNILNSTFVENQTVAMGQAEAAGGAIYLMQTSGDTVVNIANSTFTGNGSSNTGGVLANMGGTVTITNSTISENRTGNQNQMRKNGALFNSPFPTSKLTLSNTIVSGNAGGNCANTITDGGGNLSYPDTTCPGINADPKLSSLEDNGGATFTMGLGEDSPAVDAGLDSACSMAPVNNHDQLDHPRPVGPHCDIGAVEQSPAQEEEPD